MSLEDFKKAHSWVNEWQEGEIPIPDEMKEWILSRPPAIQAMMAEFPPSCLVIGTRPLRCPAPDTFGIVSSYREPSDENPNGLISVRQHPESGIISQCQPEWLAVVGFYKGSVPYKIKNLIQGKA